MNPERLRGIQLISCHSSDRTIRQEPPDSDCNNPTPYTCRVRDEGLRRLAKCRFSRTTLATSHLGWSTGQAVRELKCGAWVGWGPLHYRTGSKVRVHALYCLPSVSLSLRVCRRAERAWPGLSMEDLKRELEGIQLYEWAPVSARR